ncbi:MAG TPA: hypothetical protein VFR33_02225, partial [Candidatus Dormibacteraeota bacterium]|nr:hypothetical protein [Candidatus Dormibacteraeota bacterium]
PPLVVRDVSLGTAQFGTDRGTTQMSAWLFSVNGVSGAFAYPALDSTAYWSGGMVRDASTSSGTVTADGSGIEWHFIGGPAVEGSCHTDYVAAIAESDAAVAIAVAPDSSRSCGGASSAVGYLRAVTVALRKPLGGRVLLDEKGRVAVACPPGTTIQMGRWPAC